MSDPIAELIETLAALRRDVDQLTKESAETRTAARQAAAAAKAGQTAAETPRRVTVDAAAIGDALSVVDATMRQLRREVSNLDAAHYRAEVDAAVGAARAGLTDTAGTITANLTETARLAEATIRSAGQHLTWKLTGALAAVVVGASLVLYGFGAVSAWRQRAEYDDLAAEITRLRAELPGLQTRAADWVQRAGRATLRTCQGQDSSRTGGRERLCAKIDLAAPRYGEHGEFAVLDGY